MERLTLSRAHVFLVVAITFVCVVCSEKTFYNVSVVTDSCEFTTDRKFLSIAIGGRTVLRTTGPKAQFKLDHPRMRILAEALAPAAVRMGGSWANFLIFNPDYRPEVVPQSVKDEWQAHLGVPFWGGKLGKSNWYNRVVYGWQWHRLASFIESVGWDMVYDVNQFLQKDGVWDDSNFRLFLDYSASMDISIPGFQLGNEPNSYLNKFGFNKTIESMVEDWKRFYAILQEYPKYKDSGVIGPDPTSLARNKKARVFIDEFMADGAGGVLTSIGLHHYYLNGETAVVEDFINPVKMDKFKTLTDTCQALRDTYDPNMPVYMTETANAFGGGSDQFSHVFVSTFLWMDELGMAAKYGLNRVHRQTFNSAAYALINSDQVTPHPDYFLSLLYKRLIEGPVLNLSFKPENMYLRLYAHCARTDFYNYEPGAIVIYYANLKRETIVLDLAQQFPEAELALYVLTAQYPEWLASPGINLNGNLLTMENDQLPEMPALDHNSDPVVLPGISLGFIVVKNAGVALCEDYQSGLSP